MSSKTTPLRLYFAEDVAAMIAEAVASEREHCAQLAEQQAASADLQVASDEARIAGAVLRKFADRIREEIPDAH